MLAFQTGLKAHLQSRLDVSYAGRTDSSHSRLRLAIAVVEAHQDCRVSLTEKSELTPAS